MAEQTDLVPVALAREVNGLEMGVLNDGTPYMTGRGVAELCGAAVSTIINQKTEWAAARRTNKLAQMLKATGYAEDQLAIPVTSGGKRSDAYPEIVVMTMLEYYAFEAPEAPTREQARLNYRRLARAGFRLFVYTALGWDPRAAVPEPWRQFHDRQLLHSVPVGYFSVFKESTDFVIAAIKAGMKIDSTTVPDVSIGKLWGKYWEEDALDEKYGARIRHEHNYPDYFPQADSNPQPMWVYPVSALGDFRIWMHATYIPKKFPKYLDSKVRSGQLPASTAELVIKALESPQPKQIAP